MTSGTALVEAHSAQLRAIFFDLDGTLCHPARPFHEVFQACCTPLLTGQAHADAVALLDAWGLALAAPGPSTTAACLASALGPRRLGVPNPLIAACADRLNAEWAAAQELLPGAAEALARLAARWPLGLVTNGPADAQRVVIARLRLDHYFRWTLVSGDRDVGIRKPDPAVFRRAVGLAGCLPSEALYVGDSPTNDVAGAMAAGMRACWLNRSAQPLPKGVPVPDLVISTLAQLEPAIESAFTLRGIA